MKATIGMREVRKLLVWIWGVGFLANFALFALLTVKTFVGYANPAWGWFLPTILPTLGLALSASTWREKPTSKSVSRWTAGLAVVVSVIYLGLVLLVTVMWAWANVPPLTWFATCGLWLGPAQGITGAVLGRFFIVQRQDG